jgi:hypothetical protein
MKNQTSPYCEIKTVTWCKDSHGLFDYESKNITISKTKVESFTRVYKEGNDIAIGGITKNQLKSEEIAEKDSTYLFSIATEGEKNETFSLHVNKNHNMEADNNNKLFLVVRSLKNDDGTPKGYKLDLGDVIRLGRIEYRVIEYNDHNLQIHSLFNESVIKEPSPYPLYVKDCDVHSQIKKQCRICLMDEQDVPEPLINPCSCKGTSEYVHIQCLQDWIASKLKTKVNLDTTCYYWKRLICEVCKVSLPDLVDIDGTKQELVPIKRPNGLYILLERVFYDKSKENADSAKMMVLLNIVNENQQIKLGRGHECDLRENDISVSRLHAFIKYEDGHFTIVDNNSKFGTLVLLRKNFNIERKKKIALQLGRTVTTFCIKQTIVNNIPTPKNQLFMEKQFKWQSPKAKFLQLKPTVIGYTRPKNIIMSSRPEPQQTDCDLNGSFLD